MVQPIDIFDVLSDSAEGRRISFQTFLDRFRRPDRSAPGGLTSTQFKPITGPQVPGGVPPVAGLPNTFATQRPELRNQGLVTDFNRPFISNLLGQAENEFFADQGTRIQAGDEPTSFTDFLNNDFNLGRRVRRAPSQQVGRSPSRFAGPARRS